MNDRPDRGSRRPVWRWVVGLAALILVVGVLAAIARPRGLPVQVAQVTRGDLVVPVQCDGTLEPPPGGELRAAEAATVAELLVREGDRVARETPLLRLENPNLAQKALEARSEAVRLAADRAELERSVAHYRAVFEASKRLLASGAITRIAYEADELALEQAEGRLRATQSRLALAERSAGELERRVAAMTVRAPLAGVVYGLPRRVGEAIEAGQVVANVIDARHRRVRARVDQPDLPRIHAGQSLLVFFDGLPRERWEGEVTFVAPGLREADGREVGEVLGEITDPEGKLPANAAVDVQIVTGSKSGTLVVPRASLLRDGDRRFVYRLEAGRARRREVRAGLLGLTEVEILGGLEERDSVILPGSTPLSDGLRVRATKA